MHTRRTKIVCTLGPASSSRDVVRALVRAGMNVARINFSHGTHEKHAETIALVRAVAAEEQRAIAILGDLQGPRIRIGVLPEPRELRVGEEVTLVHEGEEGAGEIPVTYTELANDVRPGNRILINDGLITLNVVSVSPPRVKARVVHGGKLSSNKGMNLPGATVSAPSLTEKDRADVRFAVEQELDYLALSFVRKAEDVAGLRALLPKSILIVAKIEKDQALDNIEEILEASDAVMVARGDLGVELPFEEVPLAQKRIIACAQQIGRPVITATQMLESMIENPRPTRAEASDVANAILDGTDAVMLSAETAAGSYPVLAVDAMQRIITEVETHPLPALRRSAREERRRIEGDVRIRTESVIAAATVTAVRLLQAPLAIVFTKSGFAARIVASHRPDVPILGLTDSERTGRQLALVWGVVPQVVRHCESYEEMVSVAREAVLERELAQVGDRIVVTAGVPFDVAGTTNVLRVETL